MNNACTHKRTAQRWVEAKEEPGDWGYEEEHWEEYTESYLVDISLHKYQCTKCKQIFNYSSRG